MNFETLVVLFAVAFGCAGFYLIGRYYTFFSKHFGLFIIGIPVLAIIVSPSVLLVLPFIGKETWDVPVLVESISEYRGSGAYRPGKHGRVIELGFDTLTLSSTVDGATTTDTWVIPSGFGPFEQGETYEGIATGTESKAQLAIRSVIRFPFTFGQFLVSLVPGAFLFVIFVSWVHDKRNNKVQS